MIESNLLRILLNLLFALRKYPCGINACDHHNWPQPCTNHDSKKRLLSNEVWSESSDLCGPSLNKCRFEKVTNPKQAPTKRNKQIPIFTSVMFTFHGMIECQKLSHRGQYSRFKPDFLLFYCIHITLPFDGFKAIEFQ